MDNSSNITRIEKRGHNEFHTSEAFMNEQFKELDNLFRSYFTELDPAREEKYKQIIRNQIQIIHQYGFLDALHVLKKLQHHEY